MSPQPTSGFDRLRPRTPLPEGEPVPAVTLPGDEQGRKALFSVSEPAVPAFGSVSIECSDCAETSVLSLRQALRLALPSLYLPVLRGRYPAWLHCPACGRFTWTRVRVRL